MAESRKDQSQAQSATILAAETLRSGGSPPASEESREDKKIPLLWRIFGGTVLSIAAMIAVTLYQQMHNKVENLSDVLVKKDEFFSLRKGVWDQLEKLRGQEQGVDGDLQQRCSRLEQQAKASEDLYRELAPEVKQMRETFTAFLKENALRLEQQVKAGEEERKKLLGEVQHLRERLASVERKKASARVKTAGYEKDD